MGVMGTKGLAFVFDFSVSFLLSLSPSDSQAGLIGHIRYTHTHSDIDSPEKHPSLHPTRAAAYIHDSCIACIGFIHTRSTIIPPLPHQSPPCPSAASAGLIHPFPSGRRKSNLKLSDLQYESSSTVIVRMRSCMCGYVY